MSQSQTKPKTGARTLARNVRFWAATSVLVSLISLALPWWGVDTTSAASPSWGLFWGLQNVNNLQRVVFFPGLIDKSLSANYAFDASIVALTSVLVVLGAALKRWPFFLAGLLASAATDLAFVAEVGLALGSECSGIGGVTCISGYVGQGTDPFSGSIVSWGFKPGFYLFLASGFLILSTLALQRYKDNPMVID